MIKYWTACFVCILCSILITAAQAPMFERIGAAEGLSQGMIFDVIQDQRGFIWFATRDGLNRYDGYRCKIYLHDPFDPFSPTDNEAQVLLEDRLGRIWIGTVNNGLDVFDPATNKFYHLKQLSSPNVLSLAEAPDGSIWVGSDAGLDRIVVSDRFPENDPFLDHHAQIEAISIRKNNQEVRPRPFRAPGVIADPTGNIWVNLEDEIGYIDPHERTFHPLEGFRGQGEDIPYVARFRIGPDGLVWIGLPGRIMKLNTSQCEVFYLPKRSPFPRTDMAFDAAGNLFVSTRKQLYKMQAAHIQANQAVFDLIYEFPSQGIEGSTNIIFDRNGLLWMGTNGYGARKYNPGSRDFEQYFPGYSPRRIVADAQGRIWSWLPGGSFWLLEGQQMQPRISLKEQTNGSQHDLASDRDGNLWLIIQSRPEKKGGYYLICMDGRSLQEKFRVQAPVIFGLYSRLYYHKSTHSLWMGSTHSSLARYDIASGKFDVFDYKYVTGIAEAAMSIHVDPAGICWIGTPHGLIRGEFDTNGMLFTLYQNDIKNSSSLNCNSILSVSDDPARPERFCWIGTKGGGVNILDKDSGRFRHITAADGLPNQVVYAILPDESGKWWLSTNSGLSRYDPATGVFQNYYEVDGLLSNEFNTLSYAQARDGKIYLGGVGGISAFYPAKLDAAAHPPPVLISGLLVNGKPLALNSHEGSYIPLQLKHAENQLTFEFVAIDFAAPRMNQYRFRLKGAQDEWVTATTDKTATYAHLQPGDYVFEVISGGSRGVWGNKPAQLAFSIAAPWWRSWPAYFVYFALFAAAIYAYIRFKLREIRLENQLSLEHEEAARLATLDEMKSNFFNSITHEFRTPLTLILEPARLLLQNARSQTDRYRLELIEKNGSRLLSYVNQLLDLSKLEAGQMPLDWRPTDLTYVTKAVAKQFESLAVEKGIEFSIIVPHQPFIVLLDEGKWTQIISNLLSNAFKFTETGGNVTLSLTCVAQDQMVNCLLRVADSGIGISPEDSPRIFDRFFQAKHGKGGTGIGLALSQELVARMGGRITVESVLGEGAVFQVSLQLTKADHETVALPPLPLSPEWSAAVDPGQDLPEPSPDHKEAPLVLVIEDQADLRLFLQTCLQDEYRVVTAANGALGIDLALELTPDLVISDVAMPKKDGFEVTQTLKSSLATSHIPVVLLTAKSSFESRMTGLQHGADAYLTKPFHSKELLVVVHNMLQQRARWQRFFKDSEQTRLLKQAELHLPEPENAFLQQLCKVIETNLDRENMEADDYARAMFISRSQLHRKLIALTGLSLSTFVRNYRLERAREILQQEPHSSIADVAWRTGFANAKYFSTSFKERFGMAPTEVKTKK